jgi:hypothetical protein
MLSQDDGYHCARCLDDESCLLANYIGKSTGSRDSGDYVGD